MDDLLREFLTETNEGLATLDQGLVELEQRPNDKNLLSSIFRAVHTIKGTCGFIGLPRLEKVAHAAENVLGMFRDGKLQVTGGAVTLILNSIDQIKYLLAEIEMNHTEPAGEDSALIARLNEWAESGNALPEAPKPGISMEFAPVETTGMIDAAADTVQAGVMMADTPALPIIEAVPDSAVAVAPPGCGCTATGANSGIWH